MAEEIYETLYPPTGETVAVERGSGCLGIYVYDSDGERVAWRILGRDDLIQLAKEGL